LSSEINWDGVLQIAYLLIIFIAPALLNRLRGKGSDFMDGDKVPEGMALPPSRPKALGQRPLKEDGQPEPEHRPALELESLRPALASPKHDSRSRQRASQLSESSLKTARQHKWLERLPKHELKRAVLLKTILDSPVATRH
jgi:hypothetical protein